MRRATSGSIVMHAGHRHLALVLGALLSSACAGGSRVTPATAPESTSTVERSVSAPSSVVSASATIGRYRLMQAELVRGTRRDSIFRYSDGSPAIVSVIRYDVPPSESLDGDAQLVTAREGARFAEIQPILQQQGRIEGFRVAFQDTTRLDLGASAPTLEHAIGVIARARGVERMDVQYLYLIDGRFFKIRGTFGMDAWPTSELATFARDAARRAQAMVPSR
jgi:hypothetical protein